MRLERDRCGTRGGRGQDLGVLRTHAPSASNANGPFPDPVSDQMVSLWFGLELSNKISAVISNPYVTGSSIVSSIWWATVPAEVFKSLRLQLHLDERFQYDFGRKHCP